ncbi:2-aminoethylphosphonate--pyruvate transaminase [Pelagibius litoralis]|uniref:2-aminoethylphosphonate--pyruvate transaminase n=1 Tax=Pelagibius litoralis TaxID=374515 RepID=A0A967C6N2_9PROT|nr:2-aminoethylphosphonate--pyruvate transaminase [Pelagibius litoralis]NIA67327.1 2-aminoethylphosphonate--pyruvate transaminase [Pelagibius litoralis]
MAHDSGAAVTPKFSIADPPAGGEPYLLTPGPLTTSAGVKRAMLKDWGSWDGDFRAMTADLRRRLLAIAGDKDGTYDCVPLQGSGTFVVEAMLGSFLPPDGKALVLVNGAYGQRTVQTLGYLDRSYWVLDKGDYLPPRGAEVAAALDADPTITHVVLVHCETSSGILNPLQEIAEVVAAKGRKLLIDSMSAFGALPLDPQTVPYAAMVSSANKCIEGVPGFGFVIADKTEIEAAKGRSHSLSLDIHAQWAAMEKTGQWRFTPPTHVVAAFLQALREHEAEGGVAGRGARYAANCDTLVAGMRALGFETLLKDGWLSPIIVTFFNPAHPKFDFNRFYELLKAKGFIIYPGKLTVVDSFRIGCIGRLDTAVMHQLVVAVGEALNEMGVDDASPPSSAINERAKLVA